MAAVISLHSMPRSSLAHLTCIAPCSIVPELVRADIVKWDHHLRARTSCCGERAALSIEGKPGC